MAQPLKELYNNNYITLLATTLKNVQRDFDTQIFYKDVFSNKFDVLSLKERMTHIAIVLHRHLSQNYLEALIVLKQTFQAMNRRDLYLQNMVFSEYVALYGLDAFEESLEALRVFTVNSSSEFAIRTFLAHDESKTLHMLLEFAKESNEHVRRLASEGTRPRLPWANKFPSFIRNPEKTYQILALLKDDVSAYVRKSVANHINDIAKDNPHYVTKLISSWYGDNEVRNKMLKHAARTLLKKGDTQILELFGYRYNPDITLKQFIVDSQVQIGEELFFTLELVSHQPLGNVRLEYQLEFVRKNTKKSSKNFHIFSGIIPQSSRLFTIKYSFRPITTRKYYVGEHTLSIILNGVVIAKKRFDLVQKVKDI